MRARNILPTILLGGVGLGLFVLAGYLGYQITDPNRLARLSMGTRPEDKAQAARTAIAFFALFGTVFVLAAVGAYRGPRPPDRDVPSIPVSASIMATTAGRAIGRALGVSLPYIPPRSAERIGGVHGAMTFLYFAALLLVTSVWKIHAVGLVILWFVGLIILFLWAIYGRPFLASRRLRIDIVEAPKRAQAGESVRFVFEVTGKSETRVDQVDALLVGIEQTGGRDKRLNVLHAETLAVARDLRLDPGQTERYEATLGLPADARAAKPGEIVWLVAAVGRMRGWPDYEVAREIMVGEN
jgi:hypothetical protein